jgi:transmembrane sensor
MYELISRSLENRASEAELSELRAWREAAPENEQEYQELSRLAAMARESVFAPPSPPIPAGSAIIERVTRRSRQRDPAVGRWRRRISLWGSGVTMLAAAAVAWLVLMAPGQGNSSYRLGAGEFAAGTREAATAVLTDGTVVRLAPGSRLRVPGTKGSREVLLNGTAYFAVVPMPEVPFRVRAEGGEAVVLGTRFELRTKGDSLRLVVLEGKVALGADREPVIVRAGEVSQIAQGTATAPLKVDDVRPLVSWLRRFIVFQRTPLAEAAEDLEAEYGVRIEVRDSSLAAQTLTGVFADREFDEMLGIVCGVLQATCTLDNGIATIDRGR